MAGEVSGANYCGLTYLSSILQAAGGAGLFAGRADGCSLSCWAFCVVQSTWRSTFARRTLQRLCGNFVTQVERGERGLLIPLCNSGRSMQPD